LFESVDEAILARGLENRGLKGRRQQAIPIVWEDVHLEAGFRADLLVEDKVIVEVKSVESLAPVHRMQVLTYLRLSGKKPGLLTNFDTAPLQRRCGKSGKWTLKSRVTSSRNAMERKPPYRFLLGDSLRLCVFA
jgi:GxxExxY protein